MASLFTHPLVRLRRVEGVTCLFQAGGAQIDVAGITRLQVDDAGMLELLRALHEAQVIAGSMNGGEDAARGLLEMGVLALDLLCEPGGEVLASLHSEGYAQALRPGAPAGEWRCCPHATLRPQPAGAWVLGSPLSSFRIWLARAGLMDEVASISAGEGPPLAQALWAAGLIEGQRRDVDAAPPGWSHEDLVFHAASRRHADHRLRGKRVDPAGRVGNEVAPPRHPPMDARLREQLQACNFESVLASRRSVRASLPPPTLAQLAGLLQALQAERGGPPPAASRLAYPTAGGLQSLGFHVVMAQGAHGATLHRFDVGSGELQSVASPPGAAQRLLDEAAQSWGEGHGAPAALVVFTADLARLSARYEATAYRLALLEAGGAALLLSQLATALGIGTCVLGNGDSRLFAWASGLSPWDEPSLLEVAVAGCMADDQR